MRNPQQTRHKLLQAATQELVTLGFAGIRVDRLAAEAGINKRMIYHYFGNKEGLCAWALDSQVVCLERYESAQRQRASATANVPEMPLAGALRNLLAPLLPDSSADSSAVERASLGREHSPNTDGIQRAAIILARALLDLRGAQSDYTLTLREEAAWQRVMPWLTSLAAPDGLSAPQPTLIPQAKQRLSISPKIQPI